MRAKGARGGDLLVRGLQREWVWAAKGVGVGRFPGRAVGFLWENIRPVSENSGRFWRFRGGC